MISLKIDNSSCLITGLTDAQYKELRNLMAYDISSQQSFFSGNHHATKRYLLDKKGQFPTGLLYIVRDWLDSQTLRYVRNDTRVVPTSLPGLFAKPLGPAPYPEQADAASACYAYTRGIVSAPTGVGKSVIAALIIHKLQVKTLVVVPSLELKRQLTDSLQRAFPDTVVGELRRNPHIAVENVGALSPKKVLKGYPCVIIDEFHHSGAKSYRKLNEKAWTEVYFKYGMTATPFRSRDEERLLLESVLSEVIYKIDYKTAVSKGYICPLEAYYYELPKQTLKCDVNNWASVYGAAVVNNEFRNNVITGLLDALHEAGKPTLCLVKEIAHGVKLMNACAIDSAFANGQDGECRALIAEFNSGARTSLIGTTGVLGEGVDSKPAEYIIIAGLGKSRNAFMQQVGRGFRRHGNKESCKIIIFLDKSHKWTKAHFATQVKILKEEYGVTAVKLDL